MQPLRQRLVVRRVEAVEIQRPIGVPAHSQSEHIVVLQRHDELLQRGRIMWIDP